MCGETLYLMDQWKVFHDGDVGGFCSHLLPWPHLIYSKSTCGTISSGRGLKTSWATPSCPQGIKMISEELQEVGNMWPGHAAAPHPGPPTSLTMEWGSKCQFRVCVRNWTFKNDEMYISEQLHKRYSSKNKYKQQGKHDPSQERQCCLNLRSLRLPVISPSWEGVMVLFFLWSLLCFCFYTLVLVLMRAYFWTSYK